MLGRRDRIRLAVVALLVAFCSAAAMAQDVYAAKGRWLDDQDRNYQIASLHGSYSVLTMAYGSCRRICSTSLRMVQAVHEMAEARHLAMNFVVVGLEPEEDKPADWAALRAERKLQFGNFYFLSGDEEGTRDIARRLGLRYWRYGEHTMHDLRVALVSPEGRIVRVITSFDDDPSSLLP